MTDANILTVSQFQAYAPEIDLSAFDVPTVSGFISQASKIASDFLGYTPLAETITDEDKRCVVDSDGDLLIFPAKLPIVTVSAIKIKKGATAIALNLVDGNGNPKYNIDYTARHIRYPYGELTLQGVPIFTNFYALRGQYIYVSLTYRAGWEPSALPPAITAAVVSIIKDLLSSRYNQTGAVSVTQGGISLEFASGKASKLLTDARRMLAPYRRNI